MSKELFIERNLTYLANVPSLGHVASSEMNTLMLDLLFCGAITFLAWKYKRVAKILWILGELRSIP